MDWPVCMNKNDIYFGELVPTPTSVLRSSIALTHHFSHHVTFIRAHLSLAQAELLLSSSWLSLGYSPFARVTHLRWVISMRGARLLLISLRSIAKSRLSLEMGVPFPSSRPRLYHCPVDSGEARLPVFARSSPFAHFRYAQSQKVGFRSMLHASLFITSMTFVRTMHLHNKLVLFP